MLYNNLVHSFSVSKKVTSSLHGLEAESTLDSTKQRDFVGSKLLIEEHSQQELLGTLFKSNILSLTLQHLKTLNDELRRRRRLSATSKENDPVINQQISHILM
jgi:hypothetical protein